jgi:hypothetical protein
MKVAYTIIAPSLLALVLYALVVVAEYPKFKKVEKRGPESGSVTTILPVDISAAAAAIALAFNDWVDFDRSDKISRY